MNDATATAYQAIRDATYADGLSRAESLGVLELVRYELLREMQRDIDPAIAAGQ